MPVTVCSPARLRIIRNILYSHNITDKEASQFRRNPWSSQKSSERTARLIFPSVVLLNVPKSTAILLSFHCDSGYSAIFNDLSPSNGDKYGRKDYSVPHFLVFLTRGPRRNEYDGFSSSLIYADRSFCFLGLKSKQRRFKNTCSDSVLEEFCLFGCSVHYCLSTV